MLHAPTSPSKFKTGILKNAEMQKEAIAPLTLALALLWGYSSGKEALGSLYNAGKYTMSGELGKALKEGAWAGIHGFSALPMFGAVGQSLARTGKGLGAIAASQKGLKTPALLDAMYASKQGLMKDTPFKWMYPGHYVNTLGMRMASPLIRNRPNLARQLTSFGHAMEDPSNLAGKFTRLAWNPKIIFPGMAAEMLLPNVMEQPSKIGTGYEEISTAF